MCITNVALGNLNRSNPKRFVVNSKVDLASDAPFGSAMLACAPLAFTLDLKTGTIDQKVQRSLALLYGMFRTSVFWRCDSVLKSGTAQFKPIRRNRLCYKPGRLPQRHAEQHLHGKAYLNGCVAVGLLATTPTRWCDLTDHLRIKPDCQRTMALERFVIGPPVSGHVGWGGGLFMHPSDTAGFTR